MFDLDTGFNEIAAAFDRDPRSVLNRVPGVFVLDKPRGLTSAGLLERIKRLAGRRAVRRLKRLGHAGTLDPLATGVLLVTAGRATRLFDRLAALEKEYRAVVELGVETDSYDADGRITARHEGPLPSPEEVEAALARFTGRIMQVPPPFSAVKKSGRAAYELARKGEEVRLEPRPVEVRAIRDVRVEGGRVRFTVVCSRGFYVRSLAHDLGKVLGCGGMLAELERSRVGPFSIEDAVEPRVVAEAIREAAGEEEG